MKINLLTRGNKKATDSRENRELVWNFITNHVENYPYKKMPKAFDWNHLVPIIGKINSLNLTSNKLKASYENLNYFVLNYKIEKVWHYLLEFITEYDK